MSQDKNSPPILISACLLGARCTFDERINTNQDITELARAGRSILICPEEIAGLGTPRPASHLTSDGPKVLEGQGQVLLENGDDVTERFISAAQTVLEICEQYGVKKAYLKSKSPSCGYGPLKINKKPDHGAGVTAALLLKAGIEVISCDADEDLPQPQRLEV